MFDAKFCEKNMHWFKCYAYKCTQTSRK